MHFSVISSGSKANSTYVETSSQRILIDCGLSARQLELRLGSLGVAAESLTAILVTHEHNDHVHGVATLSKRYKIPIYLNRLTSKKVKPGYAKEFFETGHPFYLGNVRIMPFSIVHDASDPVGFVVEAEGLKFVQLTDLGRVTPGVREALEGCHALVLESNYDEEMLLNCAYPLVLKQRIKSTHGHLSNHTAGSLLSDILHDGLGSVVLGHLSENSNTPELALNTVAQYVTSSHHGALCCGSIYHPTELRAVEPQISGSFSRCSVGQVATQYEHENDAGVVIGSS